MAKKEKSNKEKQNKNAPKKEMRSSDHLPALLDFTYSISNLVVLLLGVTVVLLSMYSGASLFIAVVRGCVAMLGIGICLWAMNYHLSSKVIKTASSDIHKAIEHSDKNPSVEYRA